MLQKGKLNNRIIASIYFSLGFVQCTLILIPKWFSMHIHIKTRLDLSFQYNQFFRPFWDQSPATLKEGGKLNPVKIYTSVKKIINILKIGM